MLDLLELEKGDQVLEVGCGWGSLAIQSLGPGPAVCVCAVLLVVWSAAYAAVIINVLTAAR